MRMTRKARVFLMAGVLAAATALAGCEDASQSSAEGDGPCELKIGTLGPLTGPAADFGLSMEATAKFVAAEANDKGGVEVDGKKCKVKISSYDTGYTSAGAAAGANDFASKGIKFVIGPLGATELTGMKPVAARNACSGCSAFGDAITTASMSSAATRASTLSATRVTACSRANAAADSVFGPATATSLQPACARARACSAAMVP